MMLNILTVEMVNVKQGKSYTAGVIPETKTSIKKIYISTEVKKFPRVNEILENSVISISQTI